MENQRIIQVEDKVPFNLLVPLSIQHMFAMFGASILVPFIFGINPAVVLFMNGVGTLLFIGVTKGKAPAYLGSSFAFLAPAGVVISNFGYEYALGGFVAVGFCGCILAFIVYKFGTEWIEVVLPPAAMGPVVALIGLELSGSAASNAGLLDEVLDPRKTIVFVLTLGTAVFGSILFRKFFSVIPILIAVIVGYASALAAGIVDFAEVAADKMNDSKIASFKVSCSKFRESAPEVEDRTTAKLTDTIRWFNASYAVLTDLNGWDYNRFAGLAANDDVMAMEQKSLEEWWSVTDRATADSTLDWILTEGHRDTFAEDMAYLEEAGIRDIAPNERSAFLLDQFQMTADEAQNYADMFGFYEQYGPDAIAGWDYCRAMNLMSFYYLAGYYTEQEALDKSLEIARTMQPLFESWDDLMSSYMRGYEYWAEESADERRALYEDLKTREDNPYSVDFKTELEKTW